MLNEVKSRLYGNAMKYLLKISFQKYHISYRYFTTPFSLIYPIHFIPFTPIPNAFIPTHSSCQTLNSPA
jgi:hypothetical protein